MKENSVVSLSDKKNFGILLIGQFFSVFCTFMYDFAIALFVIDLGKSNVAYTTVIVLGMIARIFVNVLGGVFVDRVNRKKIIVVCDILSGLVILPALFFVNSLGYLAIVLITVMLNIFNSFFGLAFMSAVPNLFHGEKMIMAGNSISQSIQAISAILGPIVGSVLYMHFGIEVILIINCLSFILTGIMEMFLKYESSECANKNEKYFKTLVNGYKFIGSHANLKYLCIFYVLFQTIVAPILSILLPLVVYNELSMSSMSLGIIQAAYAIGVLVGAILASTKKDASIILNKFFLNIKFIGLCLIGWIVLAIPVISNSPNALKTVVFCILLFALSTINMYLTVPLISYFQGNIDDSMRGNLFGVITTALTIGTPIGGLILGVFQIW
jgi:DHA3 family macrolide efflux protein-like MFS transporter